MESQLQKLRRFVTDESGPAVVEYIVMLALITATVLLSITNLGQNTSGVYDNVSDQLSDLGEDAGAGGEGGEGGEGGKGG
ncbi:MAG: Flp family type IVb pilin [Planctomycetaceae bacterium]|nr:Flp family type IVb pilin [Planctomycetaceae bacterium]